MKTERGAAQINIELSDSKIIVRHTNEKGDILLERNVTEGFWGKLWETLREEGAENKISANWCVADVLDQAERDEVEITEEEAKQILLNVDRYHDAEIGINWDVISCHIDMFINSKVATSIIQKQQS